MSQLICLARRVTFLTVLLSAAILGQAQSPTWTVGSLLTSEDSLYFRGALRQIIADGSGGAYIAGSATNPVTLGSTTLTGNGSGNVFTFIGHIDAHQHWQWATAINSDGNTDILAVTRNPQGDVLVAGFFNGGPRGTINFGTFTVSGIHYQSNFFVASLSAATGRWQWATGGSAVNRSLSAAAFAYSLACDPAGQIFVAGRYAGDSLRVSGHTLVTPAGAAGIFLSQLSPTGQHIHTTFAREPGNPLRSYYAVGLALASSGDIILTGSYYRGLTLDSLQLQPPTNLDQQNGFLACYIPSTRHWRWAHALPVTGTHPASHAPLVGPPTVDTQGHVFAGGTYYGTLTLGTTTLPTASNSSFFIARFDVQTGTCQWAVPSGRFRSVRLRLAGNRLYALGELDSTTTLGSTTLVARYSSGVVAGLDPFTGNWQWVKTINTPSYSYVGDLAPLNTTNLLVGGYYNRGPVRLDSLTIPVNPTYPAGIFLAYLTEATNGLPEDAATAASFFATPNPAHTTVRLTGTGPAVLLDALGREVRTATGPTDLSLDLHGLPPGLYVVRRGGVMRRLVVE